MAIYCVGQWCIDIVTTCPQYPVEDTDRPCDSIEWHLGGNCCNMARVLSHLGLSDVHFVGCLCPADELMGQFARKELGKTGVNVEYCTSAAGCTAPTTVALVNSETGTRTLIHARGDLPELSAVDFEAIPLADVAWVHFLSRPRVTEVLEMMKAVKTNRREVIVSLEIEKIQPQSENLIPFADFIFISKDYARFRSCESKEEAVSKFVKIIPKNSVVVCAWGSDGAAAGRAVDGEVFSAPASPPGRVIDTLGAGDTFNAAFVGAIVLGADLKSALAFACRVAGHKCGHRGFTATADFSKELRTLV